MRLESVGYVGAGFCRYSAELEGCSIFGGAGGATGAMATGAWIGAITCAGSVTPVGAVGDGGVLGTARGIVAGAATGLRTGFSTRCGTGSGTGCSTCLGGETISPSIA